MMRDLEFYIVQHIVFTLNYSEQWRYRCLNVLYCLIWMEPHTATMIDWIDDLIKLRSTLKLFYKCMRLNTINLKSRIYLNY